MNRLFARAIFALCALYAWSAAASAKEGAAVYTGTLGNQPIVMEIDTGTDGQIDGRYFYVKYHRDLALSGSVASASRMHMTEGKDDDASKLPQIDLAREANGNLSGTWRSPKGKTLALALQPARAPAPATDSDPYLQKLYGSDLYEYLRLSGLVLQKGRKETFMGHALQWWVEPQSKIAMFEILDGYPDAQRRKINDVLRARQWSEVSSFHACMLGGSQFGGSYDQTVTPHLLSPDAISISVATSYDCGGAHPDFGDAPINLDARTARALSLEDVLWVGKGKAFHYADETGNDGTSKAGSHANGVTFDTYSNYREKDLSPWLAQQLKALYPDTIKDEDCDYGDASVWQFPSWYLTPTGMSFTPSFARVERVCEANDDWSSIPYRIIKQHPGGLPMTLP